MKLTKTKLRQLIREAVEDMDSEQYLGELLKEEPAQSQFGLGHYFDAYDLEQAISAKMDDIRKDPNLGEAALTLIQNYITKLHNMPERGNKREKKMHGYLKRLAQDIRYAIK